MKRFRGVCVNTDGSYTNTGHEANNPNMLLRYPFLLHGDAILDTETGHLVDVEQLEALRDEYNEVDVWTLSKQNAEMRAVFARLFESATPMLTASGALECVDFGDGIPVGFVGMDTPELLDKLADAFKWLREN